MLCPSYSKEFLERLRRGSRRQDTNFHGVQPSAAFAETAGAEAAARAPIFTEFSPPQRSPKPQAPKQQPGHQFSRSPALRSVRRNRWRRSRRQDTSFHGVQPSAAFAETAGAEAADRTPIFTESSPPQRSPKPQAPKPQTGHQFSRSPALRSVRRIRRHRGRRQETNFTGFQLFAAFTETTDAEIAARAPTFWFLIL